MKLNSRLAYMIMLNYLNVIYQRTEKINIGKLIDLLSPYSYEEGVPVEIEPMWQNCIKKVTKAEYFTVEEAYKITMLFFKFCRDKLRFAISLIINGMKGQAINNVDWIKSVDKGIEDEKKFQEEINEKLDVYKYLWTTEKEDYFLAKSDELDHYVIMHKDKRKGSNSLIIENNELFKAIINIMIENGVKIIE